MLILASNSPRRKAILALGGWEFNLVACEVDERVLPGEGPEGYVRRLAENKARCAAGLLDAQYRAQAVVLAADTAVVGEAMDGDPAKDEILGKPRDAAEARSMLKRLRAREHSVLTGVAVLRLADDQLRSRVEVSAVRMRAYTDDEIAAYVATGDPFDKAGAYGVQHAGFEPVQNLHGCYPNVMGLPLCRVAALLAEVGLPPVLEVLDECRPDGAGPCRVYRMAA